MKHITLLFALLLSAISFGQDTGSVSGKILDKDFNNEPLPFANVLIKGTTKGTSTDIDGNYTLENIEAGEIEIEFSFIGYETVVKTVLIKANVNESITVAIGPSAANLDEVVI